MANGRCRLHGGTSTGANRGNTRGSKTNIYAQFMSEDDRAVLAEVTTGSVLAEIEVVKVQLARTFKAQEAWDLALATGDYLPHMVTTKVETRRRANVPEGASDEVVEAALETVDVQILRQRPDFEGLIERWTARIASLEKTEAELTAAAAGGDDEDDGAIKIRIMGGFAP